MRKKADDGLSTIERAMLARLKKGPAALSSLAHAARCARGSVKVHICRLRKKLPHGIIIPRSFYGAETYTLEVCKSAKLANKPCGCKTETATRPAKDEKKTGTDGLKKSNSNNMLYASESLPDYTLCESTLRQARHFSNLAWATILRSCYSLPRTSSFLYVRHPSPVPSLQGGR